MKRFWVYILKCADGTLYTGFTVDPDARFQLHTIGKGAKYTKGRGPLLMVYLKEYTLRSAALKRECQIKKMTKAQKLVLIEEQD